MLAAISGYVWAIFGAVLALCGALLAAAVLGLLRRLKEFKALAERTTEELTSAMESVNEQLQRASDGVGKISERRLRRR